MKIRKWDVIAYPVLIVVCIKVFIFSIVSGFKEGWEGNKFSLLSNLTISDFVYLGIVVLLIIIASIKYYKQD